MENPFADLSRPFRVGCCGWGEAKSKYFSRFGVVELQTPFYEPPSVELALKWRSLAPDEFEFSIKAWQLITHTPASPTYRRLKSKISPAEHDLVGSFRPTEQVMLAWERTLAVAQALKASVVLFQCPASFRPERENLQNLRSFFGDLSRGGVLLAWEPRGDWPDALIENICRDFDLLHCVDPFKRESVHGLQTYWRLHGKTGYSYRYSDAELAELRIALANRFHNGHAPNYVLFNNVWMKDDAERFRRLIHENPVAP